MREYSDITEFRIEAYDSIDELPQNAQQLMQRTGSEDFLRSSTWFAAVEQHLLNDQVKALYLAAIDSSNESVVSLLPLMLSRAGRKTRITSLTSPYSTRYAFVGEPADERTGMALTQLVMALNEIVPGWATIRLDYLLANDPGTSLLEMAFHDSGFGTRQFFQSFNWRYRLNGQSADDYFGSRPSRLRNTIKRRRKRLEQMGGYSIELCRNPEEIEEKFDTFTAVYQSSWKEAEVAPLFVADVVRRAAPEGRVILGILMVGDKPAAAQLWFVDKRRATIYKLAYNPEFAEYSPGTILTEAIIRDVIEQSDIEILDFGFGDEAFKRDWMDDKQPVVGLMVINTSHMSGKLRHLVEGVKSTLKRLFGKAAW